MAEKMIFGYKRFFVIECCGFYFIFDVKTATSLKKVILPFPCNPFENWVGGSTPPNGKRGSQYECCG